MYIERKSECVGVATKKKNIIFLLKHPPRRRYGPWRAFARRAAVRVAARRPRGQFAERGALSAAATGTVGIPPP